MKKKNNALYAEEKLEAYDFVVASLARAYMLDDDTDFVTHAQKVCKGYVNFIKVYNYLLRNRFEIARISRGLGSQMLHESEIND